MLKCRFEILRNIDNHTFIGFRCKFDKPHFPRDSAFCQNIFTSEESEKIFSLYVFFSWEYRKIAKKNRRSLPEHKYRSVFMGQRKKFLIPIQFYFKKGGLLLKSMTINNSKLYFYDVYTMKKMIYFFLDYFPY